MREFKLLKLLYFFITMNYELVHRIWERDRGVCQRCGKQLSKVIDEYDEVAKELSNIKEVKVFKWVKNCWRCHKETPLVSYDFAASYDYHIGDIEKLDKKLMQKYDFVKRTFSRTLEKEVIANTCVNCGALQGNWFVRDDLLKMRMAEEYESKTIMSKIIDMTIQNNLVFDDLPIEKDELGIRIERSPLGHIHHKDGNNKNDSPDNLILLCINCHFRTHSEMRKQPRRAREEGLRK